VAAREFRERGRSRAFIVSTAILLVFSTGIVVVVGFVASDAGGEEAQGIGLVKVGSEVREALATPEALDDSSTDFNATGEATEQKLRIAVRGFDSVEAGEEALREGDIDLLLVGDQEIVVAEGRDTGDHLVERVSQVVRLHAALEEAGVEEGSLERLVASEGPEVRSLEPVSLERLGRLGVTAVAGMLLFVVLLTSSGLILTGVVEEKTSRVVEVLVSTVGPKRLLAGKVLGLGALGLTQFVIIALPFLVPALIAASSPFLPEGWQLMIPVAGLWGLLGFAFYAYALAAVGSLVSRLEDVQTAVLPIWLPLFLSFYLAGPTSIASGDSVLARVLSFLPPTAPVAMLGRIGTGTVQSWEVVLSVALMAGAIWLMAKAATRIYAAGVLHSGRRLKLRNAWRTAET
jgi:ABC-2 type transport system permease protein